MALATAIGITTRILTVLRNQPIHLGGNMSYQFKTDRMYLMPTHFGPSLGPRQGPDGHRFSYAEVPKNFAVYVNFLSNREQLTALLPEGFQVAGEPVVTIAATYMKELPWLAGRGYNMLGLTIPATFKGQQDTVTGDFMTVLWENMADPIITGREELGVAKLYCELPDPVTYQGVTHCTASWEGFKFLDVYTRNMRKLSPEEMVKVAKSRKSEGLLHYKYMPRTGQWGTADAQYATFTPSSAVTSVPSAIWLGDGSVEFHSARWEDMPSQYNIVNTFHGLDIVEFRGAMIIESVGGMEGREQRILK
ncbi:MAG: acetoacetate decarboxylase family protein [Caldilineaceae bacterium]